jgi:hypothetical protein
MVPRNVVRTKAIRRKNPGQMYGITISYRAIDIPLVTSRVGYGWTFDEALEDADSQLSDGTWRRIVVSHPNTIYSDIQEGRAARFARSTARRGEGVVIKVEKRITTVVPER